MRRIWSSLAALGLLCTPAMAATLDFLGTALPTCALTGGSNGAIALGADLKSWSTTTPASIVATNTALSTITVTRPTSWASSPASPPDTTFTHTATITGVNASASFTSSGSARTAVLSLLGVNTVSVWLSATASEPFMPGSYMAQVTVTCAVN